MSFTSYFEFLHDMNCQKDYWVFLVIFAIALLTGLNTRAFGNQILSALWKFWYFEWHLNGNKLCYACLMHWLICQKIRFFGEVNDIMYQLIYPYNIPIFAYFTLIFQSPCKINVSCGCAILVLWHRFDVTKIREQLIRKWWFVFSSNAYL